MLPASPWLDPAPQTICQKRPWIVTVVMGISGVKRTGGLSSDLQRHSVRWRCCQLERLPQEDVLGGWAIRRPQRPPQQQWRRGIIKLDSHRLHECERLIARIARDYAKLSSVYKRHGSAVFVVNQLRPFPAR